MEINTKVLKQKPLFWDGIFSVYERETSPTTSPCTHGECRYIANELSVNSSKEEIQEQLSFFETNEKTKGYYLGIDTTSSKLIVLTKPLEDDETLLYDFVREEKPEGQRDARNLLQCCNIAASIAEQLADLHDIGVIHGSLSSLSVSISKLSHKIKIRNFGLTKIKEDYYSTPEKQYVPFDKEKMKLLDPHNFMPPEIFWSYLHLEKPKIEKHTDVFSFGLLLWEIFEGGFVHFFPSDILSRHSLIKREQGRIKNKGASFNTLPLLFFDQNYFTNTPKEIQEVIYNCITEDPFARNSMRAIAMKLRSICKYNLKLDTSFIIKRSKLLELFERVLLLLRSHDPIKGLNVLASLVKDYDRSGSTLPKTGVISKLCSFLTAEDSSIRNTALEILELLSERGCFALIFARQGLGNAVNALYIPDDKFVARLANLISSVLCVPRYVSEFIRVGGIVAIAEVSSGDVHNFSLIHALLRVLSKCLRYNFAYAAAMDAGAISVLMDHIQDDHSQMQSIVLECISRLDIGPTLFPRLSINLSVSSSALRSNAARLIARISASDTVKLDRDSGINISAVLPLLKEKSPKIIMAACAILARIQSCNASTLNAASGVLKTSGDIPADVMIINLWRIALENEFKKGFNNNSFPIVGACAISASSMLHSSSPIICVTAAKLMDYLISIDKRLLKFSLITELITGANEIENFSHEASTKFLSLAMKFYKVMIDTKMIQQRQQGTSKIATEDETKVISLLKELSTLKQSAADIEGVILIGQFLTLFGENRPNDAVPKLPSVSRLETNQQARNRSMTSLTSNMKVAPPQQKSQELTAISDKKSPTMLPPRSPPTSSPLRSSDEKLKLPSVNPVQRSLTPQQLQSNNQKQPVERRTPIIVQPPPSQAPQQAMLLRQRSAPTETILQKQQQRKSLIALSSRQELGSETDKRETTSPLLKEGAPHPLSQSTGFKELSAYSSPLKESSIMQSRDANLGTPPPQQIAKPKPMATGLNKNPIFSKLSSTPPPIPKQPPPPPIQFTSPFVQNDLETISNTNVALQKQYDSAHSTPAERLKLRRQTVIAKEVSGHITPHPIPRRHAGQETPLLFSKTTVGLMLLNDKRNAPSKKSGKKAKPRKIQGTFFQKCTLGQEPIKRHELLGSGGSGSKVYRVSMMGLSFAEKSISADTPQEVIDQFKHEITVMSMLDNKNIVKYLGHSITGEECSVFMEYFINTLGGVISKKTDFFSVLEVTQNALQIAQGINYLHTLTPMIIHRDIKSENVFVELNASGGIETLKLGDFDTAKIVEQLPAESSDNPSLDLSPTQKTRFMSGTIGWIAPELFVQGEKTYTEKVDIWSFGMVLYEMIELEQPFSKLSPLERTKLCEKGDLPEFTKLQTSDERTLLHEKILALFEQCTLLAPERRPSADKIVEVLLFIFDGIKNSLQFEGSLQFPSLLYDQVL